MIEIVNLISVYAEELLSQAEPPAGDRMHRVFSLLEGQLWYPVIQITELRGSATDTHLSADVASETNRTALQQGSKAVASP